MTVGPATIEVVVGDITERQVDAIVNAAGPELLQYCRGLGGCPTGQTKVSPGFSCRPPSG